jgi:hypothetical protein
MAAMGDYLEDALLSHVLDGIQMTTPTSVYVALYNTTVGDDDSGTEVTGGAYARVIMTGGWTVSGTTPTQAVNTAPVTFPTATDATWGDADFFAIFDSLTSGGSNNLLIWGAITVPKTIGDGDTFEFDTGNLIVEFA